MNESRTPTAVLEVPRDEATRLKALRAQRRVWDLLPLANEVLEQLLTGFLELWNEVEDPKLRAMVGREARKTLEVVLARTVPTVQRFDHRALVMAVPLGAGEASQANPADAEKVKAEQSQTERTELLRQILARDSSNGTNGHRSRPGLVILGGADGRQAG